LISRKYIQISGSKVYDFQSEILKQINICINREENKKHANLEIKGKVLILLKRLFLHLSR